MSDLEQTFLDAAAVIEKQTILILALRMENQLLHEAIARLEVVRAQANYN